MAGSATRSDDHRLILVQIDHPPGADYSDAASGRLRCPGLLPVRGVLWLALHPSCRSVQREPVHPRRCRPTPPSATYPGRLARSLATKPGHSQRSGGPDSHVPSARTVHLLAASICGDARWVRTGKPVGVRPYLAQSPEGQWLILAVSLASPLRWEVLSRGSVIRSFATSPGTRDIVGWRSRICSLGVNQPSIVTRLRRTKRGAGVSSYTWPKSIGRLEHYSVSGLFGTRDIDFALDERAPTLLTGVNGTGKSTVLRTIDAISTGRWAVLFEIPFSLLTLRFSSGAVLKAEQTPDEFRL